MSNYWTFKLNSTSKQSILVTPLPSVPSSLSLYPSITLKTDYTQKLISTVFNQTTCAQFLATSPLSSSDPDQLISMNSSILSLSIVDMSVMNHQCYHGSGN